MRQKLIANPVLAVERSGLRKTRLRAAASILASSALLAVGAGSNKAEAGGEQPDQTPQKMQFVGQEDQALSENLSQSEAVVRRLAEVGFDTLKITVPWTYPAQCSEINNDTDRFQNAAKSAKDNNLNLAINIIPQRDGRPGQAPTSTSQIRCYTDTAVSYMTNFAKINPGGEIVIEMPNEPNSDTFWRPQKDESGEWIAPSATVKLLAVAYPKLKTEAQKLGIKVKVYGPGLASSHQMMQFISEAGKYISQRGIKKRILDGFSLHPYGAFPSEAPDVTHPGGSVVAFADFPALKNQVTDVFGNNIEFWYSEYGIKERINTQLSYMYRQPSVFSDKLASEARQAEYYSKAVEMAYCQDIPLTFFNVIDDADGEWTSGLYRPIETITSDAMPGSLKKLGYYAVSQAIARAKSGQINC